MLIFIYTAGVHDVRVWGQAGGGDCRAEDPGLGPEEHGIRPTEAGVQSQVPDTLYPMLPQQTGIRTQLH